MRKRKFMFFILFSIIFYPFFVFAYDDQTTHPGLTQEAIALYNKYKFPQLNNVQKGQVIQGSIDEDNPHTKSLNHFYDPIRGIGIFDYRNALDWALGRGATNNDYSWPKIIQYYAEGNEEKAFHGLGHIIHLVEDMAVPEHTRNDPHMSDNFTGISPYENWVSENKNRTTLFGMGEKLKINSFDSAEKVFSFLSSYTNSNYFSKDTIRNATYQYPGPVINKTVGNYSYGLDNFFGEEHKLVISYDDKDGNTILKMRDDEDTSVLSEYFNRLGPLAISTSASVIDLFMKEAKTARENYLAEQKIKQEEEARKTAELADKLSQKGTVGLIFYGLGSAISDTTQPLISGASNLVSSFATGIKGTAEDVVVLARTGSFIGSLAASAVANKAGDTFSDISKNLSNINNFSAGAFIIPPNSNIISSSNQNQIPSIPSKDNLSQNNLIVSVPQKSLNVEISKESQNSQPSKLENYVPTSIQTLPASYKPGFGAGGNLSNQQKSVIPEDQNQIPSEQVASSSSSILQRPQSPKIISPISGENLNSDQVVFIGTAEAGMIISAEGEDNAIIATTTAGLDGSWQFSVKFANGQLKLNFFAVDFASTTNRSLPTELSFLVNNVLPDVALQIGECSQSLSSDSCLVLGKTLNITWSSASPDIDYFLFDNNGVLSATTSTSTTMTASQDSLYVFSVSAVDKFNHYSATTTKTVEINSMPIVISEIDWDGTQHSPSDEWMEIHNRTNTTINLSNFVLRAEDGSPYINLTNSISPKGYFLIERKNSGENDEITQSPVQAEVADMWVSFGNGLKNDGEHLFLDYKNGVQATTTIFEVALCDAWCGYGSSDNRSASMEWLDSISVQNPFGLWRTAFPLGKSKDRDGNVLVGSPKAKNSTDYLINNGSNQISKDLILTKENGPYITDPNKAITVSKGVTVTLEPGVVIKSFNRGVFNIYGHLVVNGTTDQPVVFTSLYDDEYGGDFNNDGGARPPAPGDWQGVRIFGPEATSTIGHAVFRYGGLKYPGSLYSAANLYTEEAPVTISDSLFEYGYTYGANISNVSTNAIVLNNIFRNTTKDGKAYGLAVSATGAIIEGNRISGNGTGLGISAINGGSVKNNVIENNTGVAVYMGYLLAGFNIEGNSGHGNGTDSIQMIGDLSAPGITTILGKNSLPYQNMGLNVPANSTVKIASGAVIKSGSDVALMVGGNLEVLGSSDSPVVFTSIEDDSDGVDVNHDGEVTPTTGSGNFISFSNAVSKIENAVFRYFGKALEYVNSPIDLENVVFENNNTALVAVAGEKIIRALNLSFTNNAVDTTIPLGP